MDPMARLKPLDAWGVDNEVLSVELFQRFLRITQGLEAPRDGLESSAKYKPILPYFVLGTLAAPNVRQKVAFERRDIRFAAIDKIRLEPEMLWQTA